MRSPRSRVALATAERHVGAQRYPWLPVSLLSQNRYPSIARIGGIAVPLLILHSRDDTTIPLTHGEQLYAEARGPKTLIVLQGPHVAGLNADPVTYRAAVEAFIQGLALP